MRAILDTSVFIRRERGRDSELPAEAAISVVTLAELELGVLLASPTDRPARLRTLDEASQLEALPIDRSVGHAYARIVAAARRLGRRPRAFDSLIAATAIVQGADVYTADADFSRLPEVVVIRLP